MNNKISAILILILLSVSLAAFAADPENPDTPASQMNQALKWAAVIGVGVLLIGGLAVGGWLAGPAIAIAFKASVVGVGLSSAILGSYATVGAITGGILGGGLAIGAGALCLNSDSCKPVLETTIGVSKNEKGELLFGSDARSAYLERTQQIQSELYKNRGQLPSGKDTTQLVVPEPGFVAPQTPDAGSSSVPEIGPSSPVQQTPPLIESGGWGVDVEL